MLRPSCTNLRYVQINTNRSATSMDLAMALAARKDAHFVLSSEPNIKTSRGQRWVVDRSRDAAIARVGTSPDINNKGAGNGFVWIRTCDMYVYSCYVSPSVPLETFENFLHDLFVDVMDKPRGRVILTGDFNSKSPLWGSNREDRRGAMLGELMGTLGLTAMYHEGVPTFVRGDSRTVIDVTMVTEDIAHMITKWEVLDDVAMSPHRFIVFELGLTVRLDRQIWKRGPINRNRLSERCVQLVQGATDSSPEEMVTILAEAYNSATHKVRTQGGRIPYWWTDQIGELRRDTLNCRRRLTRLRRARPPEDLGLEAERLRSLKKELTNAIRNEKRRAWNKLLDDLDNYVFGDAYGIVKKSMGAEGPGLSLTKEEEKLLIDRLFPVAREQPWRREHTQDIPPFTVEEVREAAAKLKRGKAPGPDGVPAEVLQVASEVIGDYMVNVYNSLLSGGTFPGTWKVARVVFIEKPRKTPEAEKTFRPLCLIDAAGRIYESLVNKRIVEELDRREGLSPHQHGFRAGHSTTGAIEAVIKMAKTAHREREAWCLLGLVDVRNAFNTASWPKIIEAVEDRGISPYLRNVVRDYLTGRSIRSKFGNRRSCNVGVPQGSVIGPTLWNIMYDGLLRMETMEGVKLVGYADDVAVVVTHRDWATAKANMASTMRDILGWLNENGLDMAPEKTDLVALKYGRRRREGTIEVARHEVSIGQTVKYLGVWLDTSVSFGPHIKATAAKASRTVTALTRLMPNIGGPGELKRRMLGAVANSVMLYGAPI